MRRRIELRSSRVAEVNQVGVECGDVGSVIALRQRPVCRDRAAQKQHRVAVHAIDNGAALDLVARTGQLGVRPAGAVDHGVRRSRRIAPDRTGSRTGRPCPRASPDPPSRCSPPTRAPPGSPSRHPRSRRQRRSRLRQRGRPLRRPAPTSCASFASPYAGRGCVLAALAHRGVENRHTGRRCCGWNPIRVDEWVGLARIRKVSYAVVADALSERESSLLLLGTSLVAREPRGLQVLARVERVLERSRTRVQRRAVRYRVDRQRARRVGVRKRADTVGAHALGELHRFGTSGRRAGCTAPAAPVVAAV